MKELKPKVSKLGAIMTGYDPTVPAKKQAENAAKMTAAARFVSIYGPKEFHSVENPQAAGLGYILTKEPTPLLRNMAGDHLMKFHGDSTFAFASPKITVNDNWERPFEHAATARMERAWGFYVTHPKTKQIVVIAATGPLIDHLIQALPYQLPFKDGVWQDWMHTWAQKTFMRHRYFDASDMGLVSSKLLK